MSKAQPLPLAFVSYVRFDDQHEDGRLSVFRERLSGEVRMQTGEDFPIFQDRNDIKWGQNWEERIVNSIDEVTFLIPIITPSFFKSDACRFELEQFIKREEKLGRNDLILPLYYVGTPVLDDDAKRAADNLAEEIAKHQYADWRDLRFEPFTSPEVWRTIARLAEQIRDAINRTPTPAKTTTKRNSSKKRSQPSTPRAAKGRGRGSEQAASAPQASESGERGENAQRSSAKNEPITIIVDSMHRGDYPTINEAIQAAKPGYRILIRPGLYQESIVIDKPLEIIGDGEIGDVVVQAVRMNAVLFKATMGRISNLSLRQMGGGNWYCIDIAQGRLELEGCDITSQSLACVAIHDGADPRLRRNAIHNGIDVGVMIYKNGLGTLEDNDIFGNAYAGVEIKEGSNPILRRNRIHDGKTAGISVWSNAQGVLEDNDIFGHAYSGVEIKGDGNPTLRRNRIHDCRQTGVFIHHNGHGILEENDIFENVYSGVYIKEGGNPTLRHNRINKNSQFAVSFHDASGGVIEDNDLRENALGAWYISDDSKAKVKRARNQE